MSQEDSLGLITVTPQQYRAFMHELEATVAAQEVDLSTLSFLGLIGTATEEGTLPHDIDLLAFPRDSQAIATAMETLDTLSTELHKRLATQGMGLSTCPRKAQQEATYERIQGYTGRQQLINLHRLFFTDLASLEANNPQGFFDNVRDAMYVLHGSFAATAQLPLQPRPLVEALVLGEEYNTIPTAGLVEPTTTRRQAAAFAHYANKHYDLGVSTTGIAKATPAEAAEFVRLTRRELVDTLAA